jgi:hypothetical protein
MYTNLKTKTKRLLAIVACLALANTTWSQVTVTATGGTTSASYLTLNAFFTAVNAGTHTGIINATITSNINEGSAFTPTSLNASGQGMASYFSVNISTSGNYTVSGSPIINRSLIELNGADNVTIDGNLGGTRALTFENTAATSITGSAVIRLIGAATGGLGCTNDTIRSCNIIGNGDMVGTTASAQFGIYVGGTATPSTSGTGELHTNLFINNNTVMRAIGGIHVAGATTAGNNANNINITNNIIGSHATNMYVRWRGIGIGNATNSIVRGNTIFNVRSSISSNSSGIEVFGTASNNVSVIQNEVNRVYNLSTGGWAASGVNISGGSNHLIMNNVVWDMLSVNYSSFSSFIAAGIRLSTGTGHRILYNSVHLFSNCNVSATSPTNPISAAFYVTSTAVTGITVRNNIFSNKMTSTFNGFRAFANLFPSGYNFGTALNTINNNSYNIPASPTATTSYFVGSLNAITTLYPTLTSWRVITLADLNSVPVVNGNVPFTNDSTLSIPAQTSTEIESGGAVITGTGINNPNTDFYSINRPAFGASSPDIGAIEFNGIPADLTPPTISFTDLSNTPSTLNRQLIVTITDPSRIDTGINAPRLYFKKTIDTNAFGFNNSGFPGWKYVTTSDTSSPFNFTINYSLLFGGNVSVNDTIQYFVIAQDRSGNSNTITSPSTGFGGGRVDSFNTAPTPKSYIISPPPLFGTYTVGATGNYSNLTQAIGSVNLRGISSSVTLLLTDTLYSQGETFPLQLNDNIPGLSGTNTLTIKPDLGVNTIIQGSSSLGLIKLNGTDNVIIDGSNNNTTSRNLTIINTSTTTTSAVIWLASADATNGANRNIIRNCNLRGASLTTTYAGIFIGATNTIAQTASAIAPNNLNTITNNDIHTVQFGILNIGSTLAIDSGLIITNNNIGNLTNGINGGGIALYLSRHAIVSGNTIQNVRGSAGLTSISGSANTLFGIYIRNNQNSLIRYNTIHTLAGTSSQRIHGIISESPNFSNLVTPSNNIFSDNVLYHIHNTSTGNTAWSLTGIGSYGGFGDRFIYNSVQLSHPTGGNINAAAGPFAAFSNGNAVQTANTQTLEVRNNLFIIRGTSVAGATPYIHYTNLIAYNQSIVNNNSYFQNSSGTNVSHLGFFNGLARTTMSDWQTATSKDTNTISGDPLVGNITNLRPQLNSPLIGAGVPLVGFNIDIRNTTRSATATTIGAFEQGVDLNPPLIQYTNITNQSTTLNLVLSSFANISDISGVISSGVNRPTLYYKKRSDANTFSGNTSIDNGWKYVQATNNISPFSFTIDYSIINGGSVSVGDTIQYFVTAQDSIIPANVGSNPAVNFAANSVSNVISAPTNLNSYIITSAPLNGLYTIGTTGDFATIGEAVGALNLRGVSAPTTFNFIDSLYNLTTPVEITTFVGMSAANPVIFKPAPGVSARITGNINDVIFRITGARFVTFIGYNNASAPSHNLIIENLSTSGNTIAVRNDASDNTIKYCLLRGANTSATGGVVVLNTSVLTGNNNNIIEYNYISSVTTNATPHNAIYATANIGFPNQGNQIRNNYIFNYTNRGVFIAANNNNTIISGNHFFQTTPRTATAAHAAVFVDNANGSNMHILNNYIGGSDTACGGTSPMNVSGTQLIQLIYFSANNSSSHQITGNVFANMNLTTTNTGANHALVFMLNGRINCSNNIFGSDTAGSSINIAYNGTAQSNFYLIGAGGTLTPNFDTISIRNNFMGGISAGGTGAGVSLRCIDYAGSNGFFIFENNTIGSPSRANSITQNTNNSLFGLINRNSNASFNQRFTGNSISNLTSNSGILMGIQYLGATSAIIENNLFQNLISNSSTQTGTGINAAVIAMYVGSSGSGQKIVRRNVVKNIYTTTSTSIANVGGIVHNNNSTQTNSINENKIYGLYSNSNATCTINGIQHISGNATIGNNFISLGIDTNGVDRTEEHVFNGIQKQSGNTNIIYNSVRIMGSNVNASSTINTFAFSRINSGLDTLINNIFYNERSNATLVNGGHFAIGINDSINLQSRSNILFASGINGNIGRSGNNNHQSLATWQLATNLDLNSKNKAISFVSFQDLHLSGASIGDTDLIAIPVNGYTIDFDGDIRNTQFPYKGADENLSIALPVSWLSFSGIKNQNDITLNWSTASESNNLGFYVERKVDGISNFETIGFVAAKNINSNSISTYKFVDRDAQLNKINYYRLRQVDINGKEDYSKIVSISPTIEINNTSVSIYPNPIIDKAILEIISGKGEVKIEITDMSGRSIKSWTINCTDGINYISLDDTDKLNTGMYILKVSNNGVINSSKFSKL